MNISHRTGRLSRRRAASRSPLPLLHGYGRVICPAAWRDRHQIGKGRRLIMGSPAPSQTSPHRQTYRSFTLSCVRPGDHRAQLSHNSIPCASSLSDLTPYDGPDRLRARFARFSRIFRR
jgi:hypothetical protein